jgi:hypothetical protein
VASGSRGTQEECCQLAHYLVVQSFWLRDRRSVWELQACCSMQLGLVQPHSCQADGDSTDSLSDTTMPGS